MLIVSAKLVCGNWLNRKVKVDEVEI